MKSIIKYCIVISLIILSVKVMCDTQTTGNNACDNSGGKICAAYVFSAGGFDLTAKAKCYEGQEYYEKYCNRNTGEEAIKNLQETLDKVVIK